MTMALVVPTPWGAWRWHFDAQQVEKGGIWPVLMGRISSVSEAFAFYRALGTRPVVYSCTKTGFVCAISRWRAPIPHGSARRVGRVGFQGEVWRVSSSSTVALGCRSVGVGAWRDKERVVLAPVTSVGTCVALKKAWNAG